MGNTLPLYHHGFVVQICCESSELYKLSVPSRVRQMGEGMANLANTGQDLKVHQRMVK